MRAGNWYQALSSRHLGVFATIALAAGCTVQVAPPDAPVPSARSTPKLTATPAPALTLTGTWAWVFESVTKGPRMEDPCSSLRAHRFSFGEDGRTVMLDVSNHRSFPEQPYNYEHLTGEVASDGRTWTFVGVAVQAAPDGGPQEIPVRYEMIYDPARLVLKGTYHHEGLPSRPVTLVKVEYPTSPASCVPFMTPTPTPSPTASPPTPVASDAVVLRVGHTGGLCVKGGCSSELTFRADGSFTRQVGQDSSTTGRVDAALVNAVRGEIARADFAAIKAQKFTGTCPTAYDGQEVTYTFTTSQGGEVLPSCTYALDDAHPLVAAAKKVVDASAPR